MFDFKKIRPLDAVIAGVAVVVFGLAIYLGYSVWSNKQNITQMTPAARAVRDLTAGVKKKPNDLDLRIKLAQALSVAGRDKDAVQQYQAVLDIKKDNLAALSGLGFISLKQKEYKTGEGYYRRMVDLLEATRSKANEPLLESAYFYLGTALMEQKNYQDAVGYFKAALRLRRDASDTHYALAVCLREIGADEGYRESLENTLLFDPKMPEANYDLGQILVKEGDLASAAELFRISATAAPGVDKPADALEELGPFETRLAAAKKLAGSDPEKALVEARIAAALDPSSIQAALLVAKAYEDTGDKTKAAQAYTTALEIDAQNTQAKDGLKRVTDGS